VKVSIFGLGYVGAVTAGCLSRDGYEVVGGDVNADKVARVAAGGSPIVEAGLPELLAAGSAAGRLTATVDAVAAVAGTDVSMISVGTPPNDHGVPYLGYVERVCREIGAAVAAKGAAHVVVLRSTVPPGTTQRCAALLAEAAGAGTPLHVAFNPEFLREGSAIRDYDHPAYTIIGTEDALAEAAVRELYACVDAPVHVVPPAVAEMVKYVANTWHATKIGFANEVGRVAKAFGVDGREVMHLITQDTKLNVSSVYMRPGFAYGGSCLPKDVNALLHYAGEMHVPTPLLSAVPASNQAHIEEAVKAVLKHGRRRVAVLGLAFKPGTDDLRESPAVPLVKRLIGEGCEVRIYDCDVHTAQLMGTNLAYIREHIPHFEALLTDTVKDCLAWSEVVVVTYASDQFATAVCDGGQARPVVDLAGLFDEPPGGCEYDGIAW
jgi:GDP-mannose 6-dehydrogenase